MSVQFGLPRARFASRRTLVARRFVRNRPAVVSLVLLVVLFVGCYALPPLLPYSHTDMDFGALLQPPDGRHLFGTNALGQDVFAQTLGELRTAATEADLTETAPRAACTRWAAGSSSV